MSTGADGKVDVRERGASQQTADRRLFMQLQAFGGCSDVKPLVRALEASRLLLGGVGREVGAGPRAVAS